MLDIPLSLPKIGLNEYTVPSNLALSITDNNPNAKGFHKQSELAS